MRKSCHILLLVFLTSLISNTLSAQDKTARGDEKKAAQMAWDGLVNEQRPVR